MSALHQLLAATDLSPPSLYAVDRGFQIAAQARAGLTILHALELDAIGQLREILGGDTTVLSRRIAQEARETLTQLASDPSRNRGVKATLKVEAGMVGPAVHQCAEELGADILVVGAHGRRFVQSLVLGSTASRLLRMSRRPVLVVKEPCRSAYRRVLVAVDFSPASTLAIGLAQRIAPGADLILFHAFDVLFEGKMQYAGVSEEIIHRYRAEARARASRRLGDTAGAAGLSSGFTTRVKQGYASAIIVSEVEICGCDLLVVGKHGTNFTEELLLGSVTSHLLSRSRCDVLVVVDKRAPAEEGMDPGNSIQENRNE